MLTAGALQAGTQSTLEVLRGGLTANSTELRHAERSHCKVPLRPVQRLVCDIAGHAVLTRMLPGVPVIAPSLLMGVFWGHSCPPHDKITTIAAVTTIIKVITA